jgi:hypothetical protein
MKRPCSDLRYNPGICQEVLNEIIQTLRIAVPIQDLNPGPPRYEIEVLPPLPSLIFRTEPRSANFQLRSLICYFQFE